MKYLILAMTLFFSCALSAQNVIPSTMTVETLSTQPKGTYRFYTGPQKDTVDFNLDSQACPACPACPTVPACPPAPAPRIWAGMSINTKTGVVVVTYKDGTTSTHTLLNPIVIQ